MGTGMEANPDKAGNSREGVASDELFVAISRTSAGGTGADAVERAKQAELASYEQEVLELRDRLRVTPSHPDYERFERMVVHYRNLVEGVTEALLRHRGSSREADD